MPTKCIDSGKNYSMVIINTSDNNINNVANKYIKERKLNVKQSVGYNVLLLYISKNIEFYTMDKNNNPDYTDINKLDYYFMIFTELCSICEILPSIQNFSVFCGVPYYTIRDWQDGTNRSVTHTPIVKKWAAFCKSCCISEAGNGNVGAIYISKALYGMSDTPAPASYTQNNVYINAPMTPEQIDAEFADLLPDDIIDAPESS